MLRVTNYKVIKEIKKSKLYKNISVLYIENENNYKSKTKLKKMLPDFKLIKLDQFITIKDKNINMVFLIDKLINFKLRFHIIYQNKTYLLSIL